MGVNVEERGGERGSGWESEWDVREGEWGGRERERECGCAKVGLGEGECGALESGV